MISPLLKHFIEEQAKEIVDASLAPHESQYVNLRRRIADALIEVQTKLVSIKDEIRVALDFIPSPCRVGNGSMEDVSGLIGPSVLNLLMAIGEITDREKGQPDGWRPMFSAPKDGSDALLVWQPPLPVGAKATVVLTSWMCRKHHYQSRRHECPIEADCDMGWGSYAGEMMAWQPPPRIYGNGVMEAIFGKGEQST